MIDPTPEFRRLIAARADERGLRLSQQDVIEVLAYVEALQGERKELRRYARKIAALEIEYLSHREALDVLNERQQAAFALLEREG